MGLQRRRLVKPLAISSTMVGCVSVTPRPITVGDCAVIVIVVIVLLHLHDHTMVVEWQVVSGHVFLQMTSLVGFAYEGGSNVELALSEEMPCDGAVDEIGVLGHGIVLGGQGAGGEAFGQGLAVGLLNAIASFEVMVDGFEALSNGVLEACEGERCGVGGGGCWEERLVRGQEQGRMAREVCRNIPLAISSLAFCRMFIRLSTSATAAVRRSLVPFARRSSSLKRPGMSVSHLSDMLTRAMAMAMHVFRF